MFPSNPTEDPQPLPQNKCSGLLIHCEQFAFLIQQKICSSEQNYYIFCFNKSNYKTTRITYSRSSSCSARGNKNAVWTHGSYFSVSVDGAHLHLQDWSPAALTVLANRQQCGSDWTCRFQTAASAALQWDDTGWFQVLCVLVLILSVSPLCSPVTHTEGKFSAQLSKLTAVGRTQHDEL